jgi:hypothetical protein
VDGRSAGQPADGGAGRHRPASGWVETEDADRRTVRLLGQGLAGEQEVVDRVVDLLQTKEEG